MGKASRNRRRAAAVKARRTRNNSAFWYAGTVVIVAIGIIAVVLARSNSVTATVAPQSGDHWHAALGVYLCNEWQGDGNWPWPNQTAQGSPARPDGTYAGLHSHGDGLIHIEPSTPDEMGRHATLGQYFKFGGWTLNSSQITFDGATKKKGDTCGSQAGEVRWEVNSVVKSGNPADYKINDGDAIVVAFVPKNFNMKKIAQPPSVKNLSNPNANEGQTQSVNTTAVPNTTAASQGAPTTVTSVPPASTPPTTVAGSTTTPTTVPSGSSTTVPPASGGTTSTT